MATAGLLLAPVAYAADAGKSAKSTAAYSQGNFAYLLKESIAKGQTDTPELRASIKEELTNRELVVRAAKQKGMDKDADVKAQMDLSAQSVLVRNYIGDYVKNNPVPDDELKKEYEAIKAKMGDKEYKTRHILVETESEAKDIITALQKGEKFEKLAAARSKDAGSKDKGGDLDWIAPGGQLAKPFADAMVALEKGKFTTTPVKTDFGWHVIQVDDIRTAKPPSFEEVKPGLQQRAQGQLVAKMIADLRAKANIK
jgi:peptidyl-prolyl cis-trans isomerase C